MNTEFRTNWDNLDLDYRKNKWKGWNQLPTPREGNTGKYIKYQILMFEMLQKLNPKNILEIGFNAGHSACCFLNAVPEATMISFDLLRHGTENLAFYTLNEFFPGKLSLIGGDSTKTVPEYFKQFPDKKFDFIFVDGGHLGDIPRQDMENTKNHVSKGGILVVDDMGTVGSVDRCFYQVDWSGFEDLIVPHRDNNNFPKQERIEKNIKILRKL